MARGDVKVITKGDDCRRKLLSGSRAVYEAVAATYSPVSGNVGVQKSWGGAIVTHDGVSVAREVFLKDEVEDMGAGLLVQSSEKSNQVSGDGTSATVILGYHILERAYQRVVAGYNAMAIRKGIDKASMFIKSKLDEMAVICEDDDLSKVATISASDPEVGRLVADTIQKVNGVGITVEEFNGLGVVQDIVDGLYFEKGWTMPHFVTDRASEEVVHDNVSIVLVEKHIKQNQDIVPIIEMTYTNTEHKTLLIIGNVGDQALQTCALTNLGGKVKICVVNPPVYGDQELSFLEDVATLTGGKVIPSSLPADKVTVDYLGTADHIVVSKTATTIFGGHGNKKAIKERIDILKDQLQSDKYSAFQKERMEMRLSKLQGKIGIIKVGGATETEIKELKFRVEDAIHATRAAKEDGIVAGGATTLVKIGQSKPLDLKNKSEQEGFNLVLEALVEPFKQLMTNAGQDGGYRLSQILRADYGKGFDVKNITDEPIDLMDSIIDPVKVIKSVVENACAFAGVTITIPLAITYDRQYQLEQVQLNKANQ